MAEPAREQQQQQSPPPQKEASGTAGERTPARRETAGWPAMGPLRASPFAVLRRIVDDVDRMFEDFFRMGPAFPGLGPAFSPRIEIGGRPFPETAWMPQIDVVERGNELVVRADLPGLKPEDVSVELRDDVLCVSGERRREEETQEGDVFRCERSWGSFCRTIPIPEGVDPAKAKATFSNGVLEVTVPLPERRAARRIEIQTQGGAAAEAGKRSA